MNTCAYIQRFVAVEWAALFRARPADESAHTWRKTRVFADVAADRAPT
jgi:hypothetical protein